MKINKLVLSLSLLILVVILSVLGFWFLNKKRIINPLVVNNQKFIMKKFASEAEFKNYITSGQLNFSSKASGFGATDNAVLAPQAATNRISTTNVQVVGIDEADIVKTDGQNIFLSSQNNYIFPMMEKSVSNIAPSMPIRDVTTSSKTKIISALPVTSTPKMAEIDSTGNLLLSNNILVIISASNITGFDVTDSKNPKQVWKLDLDSRDQVLGSRLKDNKLYLVTRSYSDGTNCSEVVCTEIYHPEIQVPVDSLYKISLINPATGLVEKKISFVGSSAQSVFYMSNDFMYLTYSYFDDMVNFLTGFYETDGKSLLPADVITKIKNLKNMDISQQSKIMELSVILENYKRTLSTDQATKIENDTQNLLSTYVKTKLREVEHSGIIKINNTNLDIAATGVVGGAPLNQFSLDEYNGNLRMAVTYDGGTYGVSDSVSDVFVLGKNLENLGKVTDLGLGERIYSVRFVADKGYVVTYKQTDPFYVLNLGNPAGPVKAGELKIPGYSSYLHPLSANLILGVGKEEQYVKLSLFDVSDPKNPVEKAKYVTKEYWSEVLSDHHAFLQDENRKVIFLPGSTAGYIFSYANDNLELVKAVTGISPTRALYINNYLYLISDSKISVVDENNWEVVNRAGQI